MDDLDAAIQEKIESDTDFQAGLESLSESEKETAIAEKREEVTKVLFAETAKAAKDNEIKFEDQRKRAEKAEADLKKSGKGGKKDDDETPSLSSTDIYTLVEAKVPQEDVDEVVRASKFLGKSLADTLKDPMVVGLLKQRGEERASAEAASTTPARPGQKKTTDA